MHSFTHRISSSLRSSGLGVALAIALLAGLATLFPSPAQAQAATADAAAQQALAKLGGNGKVLSVREKSDGQGKSWFEVQIISDGNVRVFNIPRS